MAGPTSSILLNSISEKFHWSEIYNVLDDVSVNREGDDFWMSSPNSEELPFGIQKNIIDANYYEYSEKEIESIIDLTGFKPNFDIRLYAMCNGREDHKIPGDLTFRLAKQFGGFIDFGGEINFNPKKEYPGLYFKISFVSIGGITAHFDICDAKFMEWWLKHPNFHMIK